MNIDCAVVFRYISPLYDHLTVCDWAKIVSKISRKFSAFYCSHCSKLASVGQRHNVEEPPSPRLSGSNGFSGSDGIIEPNVPTSSLDSTGLLDRMGSLDPKGYSDPKDSLDTKGSSEPTGSLYPTGSLNPKWDGLIGPNKFSSPRWIQSYNWNN